MSIHFKTTLDLIYVHNQSILCNFQLKNKVHRQIWVNLKTILRPLLSTFMSLFNSKYGPQANLCPFMVNLRYK